jgi:penicillin-binding protein 1A
MGYPGGEIPMENVHGIAVAGGTFPAQIWRRFMEPGFENRPERDFAEPRQYPVYRYFSKGDHGYLAYIPAPPTEPEAKPGDGKKKGDHATPGAATDQPAGPAIANPRAVPPGDTGR